jgi:hypothetical protein
VRVVSVGANLDCRASVRSPDAAAAVRAIRAGESSAAPSHVR